MNEFEIIRKYFKEPFQVLKNQEIILGSGDDAAVIFCGANESVHSHDAYFEGSHFPEHYSPCFLAWRTVAASVSDLVAMGAKPIAVTIALSLPKVDKDWLTGYSKGLREALDHFSMDLIGGDMVKGPRMLSLHVIGVLPQGTAITRSNAQMGDELWVTGSLGGAAAALKAELKQPSLNDFYHKPAPPFAFSQAARQLAHSAIDISDGFLADLKHVLKGSRVSAMIHTQQIPVNRETVAIFGKDEALLMALTGGDDYQLVLTAAKSARQSLLQLAKDYHIELSCVGEIVKGDGMITLEPELNLETLGYCHF